MTRSTIGEVRGCNNFYPVWGGDGTIMAPTGDVYDQPSGRMSSIRGKLVDHLGDHVVLSPEGTVLATSTGTKSLYSRPPQSLNNSNAVPEKKNMSSRAARGCRRGERRSCRQWRLEVIES